MNKTTNLCAALLLSAALIPLAASAEDAHHPDAKPAATVKKSGQDAPSPKMMENMKKMQDQMAKLHATKDPAEREKLLQEHMQSMQDMMKAMHESGGMMAGGKMMQGKMHDKCHDMMPTMMEQMEEHQKVMQEMKDTMKK